LGKPSAVLSDILTVFSSVLMRIWSQPVDLRSQRNLTFAMLGGITEQQPSRIPEVVHHVTGVAKSLGSAGLRHALKDWCVGHFVACTEDNVA
jgi:hypothetical protein